MIKTIIFDFDGTLTPLTLDFGRLREEIVIIARKYVTEEAIGELEGHYIIEMIYEIGERLKGKTGGETFEDEAFERLRVLEVEASKDKELYPYTKPVLESLKSRGINMGIITRTCMDVVKGVFPDVERYIDAIVTREHLRHVKPHPSHALEALEALEAVPRESLLVGDHPTDVLGGKAAGMLTAAVLTGRTGKEAFEEVGATHILHDIRGLLQLPEIRNPNI